MKVKFMVAHSEEDANDDIYDVVIIEVSDDLDEDAAEMKAREKLDREIPSYYEAECEGVI